MASLFLPSLIVILSLWVLQISPAQSLTCTSQNLTNNKLYDKCTDLPSLNSYLHYAYNASNSSLSVAFVSTPASSNGWVAWAINPTLTGMVGSQSLIALKSNGSLVVKTYKISSDSSIVESNLSFKTWDLSAESGSNGTVIIFGNMKVPEKSENLNQVWQVGAKVTDGMPNQHELAPANLKSMGILNLAGEGETETTGPPPGGPSQDKSGQSIFRTNNFGLFLGLILFSGSFFGL